MHEIDISANSDPFNTAVYELIDDRNRSCADIMDLGVRLHLDYARIMRADLTRSEAMNLTLDFLQRIQTRTFLSTPALALKNQLSQYCKNRRARHSSAVVTTRVFTQNYLNSIIIDELLTTALCACPEQVRPYFLYILQTDTAIATERAYGWSLVMAMLQHDPLLQLTVTVLTNKVIRTGQGDTAVAHTPSQDTFDPINKSVDTVFVLSLLYTKYPLIFGLMCLFNDFKKVLQFCELFTTTNSDLIPSASSLLTDITRMQEQCAHIGERPLDEEILSWLAEHSSLSAVSSSPPASRIQITATYQTLFESTLRATFENYENLQKRFFDSIDVTNVREVQRAYDLLSKEFGTQLNLLKSVQGNFSKTTASEPSNAVV